MAQKVKSRVIYIVLAFFLGYFGIHNFYAGYTGRGITQLLITIFTGWLLFPFAFLFVWIVLEMILITRDAQGDRFS